ncbi:MAG: tetratricopeptide repeat protein [Ardenticatenaceae bacterium]|nr:tetratricopeptide repeat protein [Anaerolineales bacterium]MCB8922045.1 tetratricopeptide repeat protein [Ardenticatenaceae bacterium]MCB8989621.1 tetratricopeptide repeat protein [Ardenticatenaceae bacterium]MCB9003162.1 tetratricopeptide repeat protein [Ardenticatenaceae bacterium]
MNLLHLSHCLRRNGCVRPFLLSLLVILLLAGCGGGEETTTSTTNTGENTVPPTSEAPQEPTTPPPTATPIPEPTLTAEEHVERGQDLARAKNYDEAIIELQASLEQEADNVDALAILGGIYVNLEQPEEAANVLNQALTIEPDHPLALSNLCSALALQGAANALATCERAIAIAPDNDDVYNALGIIYGKQQMFDEAIAAYLQAIEIKPEHEWAHNNLGRTYVDMGRYDEGIVELNEAARITPDNAMTHYNLGLAYANLAMYADAIPEYEEALRLKPSMVLTYIDMAVVYTRMEQYADAIASFETYLEVVPDADNRTAVEDEIARLQGINLINEAIATAGTVDFANPASVLIAVFDAAASGDYTNLAGLCDPLGENDGDTALICEITPEHDMAGDFAAYFGNGRINGNLLIDGDHAELPFLFGPDSDQDETMNFILRDGKWYLFDF